MFLGLLQAFYNDLQIIFSLGFLVDDLCSQHKHITMKTQTKLLLIRLAGIVSIFFTAFHAGFYWIFNWSQTLSTMNTTDRGIMLTFNLICIILLAYSVVLTLGFTRYLIEEKIGKSLLIFFTSFYILRIISEFVFFGFSMPGSILIIAMCLLPTICFTLPVFYKTKQTQLNH